MENSVSQIYQVLQKLTGLHRQLLDVVRLERESLVQADLKAIEAVTNSKQTLIEEIHQTESMRLKLTMELALLWKKPCRDLTLPYIIIEIENSDVKSAAQLRSIFNALTILIQRISAQNRDNLALVEQSLCHVDQMKKNILEEATPKSNTYTQRGQKANGPSASRLISKEA